MTEKEEILLLKRQLRELESRIDLLRDFTIDEISKTRVGIKKKDLVIEKENQERGFVY